MSRRAPPPNARSIEEVMLNRIARGETAEGAKKKATKVTRGRQGESSKRNAARASDLAGDASSIAMPLATTPEGQAIARVAELSQEIATLSQRLDSAIGKIQAPARKRSGSGGVGDDDASGIPYQEQIDHYIRESIQDIHATFAIGAASAPDVAASGPCHPVKGAQVNYAVRDLRSTVRRLDRVFYEVATGDKQRQIAAVKIQAIIRGFLVRRRFFKMRAALGQWRARKCALLLVSMEQFSAREEFIRTQIDRMQQERMRALLQRVLAEIRDITLLNLPLRRRQLEEVERRFHEKQRTLILAVFSAWKQSAMGPHSRKKAIALSKQRHTEARQRLEALERFDVITTEMIHDEFLKDNIRVVRSRHSFHLLHVYFSLLVETELRPLQRGTALAIAHYRSHVLHKTWTAWLALFRTSQVENALASATEHRTFERFEKHFNLRRIDAHYHRVHLLKHLRAWSLYCQRLKRVRRLFEVNTKGAMGQLLRRWHVRAQFQRKLRRHVIDEWHEYSRRLFLTPFRAWYVYAAQRRANRIAQESICHAYERRQRRHIKYTFFRLWKHQVLFGSIEGIHSKVHLLHSLEDQKRLCLGLEANARLYEDNITALKSSIAQLEQKVAQQQAELLRVHDATQEVRFGMHNAEQSLSRLQGMLEAVRQIHPGTVAKIEQTFKDNALLTQDLQQVLALHVHKRQQVLEKLAIDETELEIQHATASQATTTEANATTDSQHSRMLTREDQLLLHRVKWVLSRLDLQTYKAENSDLHEQTVPRETMDQLCALVEFLREGETAALTQTDDPTARGMLDLNIRHTMASNANRVVRLDMESNNNTWHAFLQAVTIKFAPERMLSVKDRLVKRAAEMTEELAALKAHPEIFNLYR